MDNDDLYQDIEEYSDLLRKYLEGRLSETERHRFAEWMWQNRKNRELVQHIKSGHTLRKIYVQREQIDPEKEYRLLVTRYPQLGKQTRRSLPVWRWSAAVILLLFGVATWYWQGDQNTPAGEVISSPEKIIAVLRTSYGEEFHLDGRGTEIASVQSEGLQVRDSLKELVCQQLLSSDSTAIHELEIPRGGEYKLVLCDGTKVWLNSESAIRFPGQFAKTSREIELRGEAYLEVARDEHRPFRIKAGKGMVEVLGTTFVMNIYPQNQQWSTTLVSGRVRVSFGEQNLTLSPGQQALIKDGELTQQKVDPEKELAWVSGYFMFQHDSLEEVVMRLSRWYNVEFKYEHEELKKGVFTGKVSRDRGIDHILSLMERMNVVQFEKKENYILIKEKAGNF